MNQEIKTKWVQALRSGEYKQARRRLRINNSFCCLGVLCDLYAKEKGLEWEKDEYESLKVEGETIYEILETREVLPREVAIWSEIKNNASTECEDAYLIKKDGKNFHLSGLNDMGNSFSFIADLIEEQL